jgi:hypothetical protein
MAPPGGKSHHTFSRIESNSQVRNASTFGLLLLTLHPRSYAWRFLPERGATFTDAGSGSCYWPQEGTASDQPFPGGPVAATPPMASEDERLPASRPWQSLFAVATGSVPACGGSGGAHAARAMRAPPNGSNRYPVTKRPTWKPSVELRSPLVFTSAATLRANLLVDDPAGSAPARAVRQRTCSYGYSSAGSARARTSRPLSLFER